MIAVQSFVPFLLGAVMLLVAGLAVWLAVVQSRRVAANLRALAQRLGLDYVEENKAGWVTNHLVTGQRDGREVRFFSFITRTGKSSTTWRAVSVRPRAIGDLLFHFQPQGLGTKLKELFGAREIVTGDAPFDAAWFLETNQPEFLRAALVPEVRAKLLAAHATARAGENFKLEEAAVRYAEHGSFGDPADCARFEQLLPVLHDLADIAEVSAERGL